MAWATPPTATTGVVYTESNLNTLRDDLLWLASPPMAHVYNSADLTIANNTETTLTFNSEVFDVGGLHSTASNTGRLTCTYTGYYIVTANVKWEANATGRREVTLRVNGSTYVAAEAIDNVGASANSNMSITSGVIALNSTDYVEVRAYQDSGGDLVVVSAASYSPRFSIVMVGQ